MKQRIQRAALHMQPGTTAERPPPHPRPSFTSRLFIAPLFHITPSHRAPTLLSAEYNPATTTPAPSVLKPK